MLNIFFGFEIVRSYDGTYVNQRGYTLDIVKDVGLLDAKPAITSLLKGHKFLLLIILPC